MCLLDAQVNVMEGCLCESLFSEKNLVSEAEQDDLTKLEIGGEVGMEVMFLVMPSLQGEEGQVVLVVLSLCSDVMLEVEDQGVEGSRVEVSGGVQLHKRAVEGRQLSEDAHECSSVHFASEDEVAYYFFGELCSLGQILVVGFELNG